MTDREVCIARYADEDVWTVDTSDAVTASRLKALGYVPQDSPCAAPYERFRLRLKAIQFRSEETLRRMRENGVKAAQSLHRTRPDRGSETPGDALEVEVDLGATLDAGSGPSLAEPGAAGEAAS